MFKRLFLALSILLASLPALADSWDSNKNIERAMDAAINAYKRTGVTGMVDGSKNCYAGLDTSRHNRNVGRDVEYCIAYTFSSAMIDDKISKAMNFPTNEYFGGDLFLQAIYTLQQANIAREPFEIKQYFSPRLDKIGREIPPRL